MYNIAISKSGGRDGRVSLTQKMNAISRGEDIYALEYRIMLQRYTNETSGSMLSLLSDPSIIDWLLLVTIPSDHANSLEYVMQNLAHAHAEEMARNHRNTTAGARRLEEVHDFHERYWASNPQRLQRAVTNIIANAKRMIEGDIMDSQRLADANFYQSTLTAKRKHAENREQFYPSQMKDSRQDRHEDYQMQMNSYRYNERENDPILQTMTGRSTMEPLPGAGL